MRLLITPRRPDTSYTDRYLWMPKEALPEAKKLFTKYRADGRGGARALEYYSEAKHHWLVPRYGCPPAHPHVDLTTSHVYPTVQFDPQKSPRDEIQERALRHLLPATHGVLELATGRGKTVMGCLKIAHEAKPALIVLNSLGQFKLWEREIRATLGIQAKHVGRIHRDTFRWKDYPITLASVDTLTSRFLQYPIEFYHYFGGVYFDEVHHYGAWGYSYVPSLFLGQRYGFTATPERSDEMEEIVYWVVGPTIYQDLERPLKPLVVFVATHAYIKPDDPSIQDNYGGFNTPRLCQALLRHPRRKVALYKLLKQCRIDRRRTLVLSSVKDVVPAVQEYYPTCGIITADTPAEKREDVIRQHDITVATIGAAGEALNAEELDTVIFATPYKWKGIFNQGSGRALRPVPGKPKPIIYVLMDTQPQAMGMIWRLRTEIIKEGYEYVYRDEGHPLTSQRG